MTTSLGPVVYRLFDEQGQLLYVGSTVHFGERMRNHACRTPWFSEVASISMELCPGDVVDRIKWARQREAEILRSEPGAYNLVGTPLWRGRWETAKAMKKRAQERAS